MIHVSRGNIPSVSANSIQSVKMAQAFNGIVDIFSLIISGELGLRQQDADATLESWYGITRPFHIVRIPVRLRRISPLPRGYNSTLFRYLASLYAALKRPDLVYSRSVEAISMAARLGVCAVLETHSKDLPVKRLRRLLEGGRLTAIVTISAYLKEIYCGKHGLPSGKVLVAPDGVDLSSFSQCPGKRELRHRFAVDRDAKIATYAGHLYENRGIEEIFRCAELMPDVLFLIVGGFPEHVTERRSEVDQRQLRNVIVKGFVPNRDIPGILQMSDVLLMPYSRQVDTVKWMSPLKMFEYMAARRPIVASSLPSIRDVLRNGINAVLVEPDSAEDLKRGIECALKDDDYCANISRKANADVQKYSWDARAAKILQFCASRPEIVPQQRPY